MEKQKPQVVKYPEVNMVKCVQLATLKYFIKKLFNVYNVDGVVVAAVTEREKERERAKKTFNFSNRQNKGREKNMYLMFEQILDHFSQYFLYGLNGQTYSKVALKL